MIVARKKPYFVKKLCNFHYEAHSNQERAFLCVACLISLNDNIAKQSGEVFLLICYMFFYVLFQNACQCD